MMHSVLINTCMNDDVGRSRNLNKFLKNEYSTILQLTIIYIRILIVLNDIELHSDEAAHNLEGKYVKKN